MKVLKRLIKAYYKANNLSFEFKNKYGVEIHGDGVRFFVGTKDEIYKLAELLKVKVKVDGDPNLIAFYTVEYDHKIRFTFLDQKPISDEQRKEIIDKFIQQIKETENNE